MGGSQSRRQSGHAPLQLKFVYPSVVSFKTSVVTSYSYELLVNRRIYPPHSNPYPPPLEPSPASKRRRMFGDSTSSENQTLQQITQPFFSPLQPTHRTKKRSRLDEDETSHHSSAVSSPPPSCEEVSKLGRDLNEQTVESARLMSENKVLKRAGKTNTSRIA